MSTAVKKLILGSLIFICHFSYAEEFTSSIPEAEERRELLRYAIESRPADSLKHTQDFLDALEASLERAHFISREQRLGLLDQGIRGLAVLRNQQIDRSRGLAQESLWRLNSLLSSGNQKRLLQFFEHKADFLRVFNEALEAMVERIPSVDAYAQLTSDWVSDLAAGEARSFFRRNHSRYRELLDQSDRERRYKVWVNRQNVETVALSSLLAAQGICIVLSAGVCAATLPGTSALSAKGLTVQAALRGAQSMALITTGSLNLIDRYRAEGYRGLLSLASVLDALLITAALPAPSRQLLMNGYRIFSPAVFRSIASMQYQAGYAAGGILMGYGSWQLLGAEKISHRLNLDGHNISANEIRRQGAMNLFIGFIGTRRSHDLGERWKQGNSVERQVLESAKVSNALQRMGNRLLSTVAPYREASRLVQKIRGAPQIPYSRVFKDAAQLGYSTLVFHAAAVLSVSYPDSQFFKRIEELPELKEGEIALTLNGFDPDDVLYLAFDSRYSRRMEIDRFIEGTNYFHDTFASNAEFFEKIAHYGQVGKIRYIRIMAHGIPGKIATRALDIEGGGGFIDAEFLKENLAEVQTIARSSMADDARIIITSCLVGANLEKPMQVRDFEIPEQAGDDFMEALGQSLMVNGGKVYSSRRMLLGFDALYGGIWEKILDSGPLTAANDKVIRNEMAALEKELEQISDEHAKLQEDAETLASPEARARAFRLLRENGKRLYATYRKVWTIIAKYGVNVEGPLFGSDRFRQDDFPKLPN